MKVTIKNIDEKILNLLNEPIQVVQFRTKEAQEKSAIDLQTYREYIEANLKTNIQDVPEKVEKILVDLFDKYVLSQKAKLIDLTYRDCLFRACVLGAKDVSDIERFEKYKLAQRIQNAKPSGTLTLDSANSNGNEITNVVKWVNSIWNTHPQAIEIIGTINEKLS